MDRRSFLVNSALLAGSLPLISMETAAQEFGIDEPVTHEATVARTGEPTFSDFSNIACLSASRLMAQHVYENEEAFFNKQTQSKWETRSQEEYQNALRGLNSEYKVESNRLAAGRGLLKTGTFIVKQSLKFVDRTPFKANPQVWVATKLVRFGTDQLLDFTAKKFEENARNSLEGIAAEHCSRFLRESSISVSDWNPSVALGAAESSGGIFSTSEFQALPDDQANLIKDRVKDIIQENSRDSMSGDRSDFLDRIQNGAGGNLGQNLDHVKSTVVMLSSFQEKQNQALQAATSSVAKVHERVNGIEQRLSETGDKVANLSELFFFRLSPREQLKALDRGLLSHLNDDEVDGIREQAQEAIDSQKSFLTNMSTYFDGANVLVGLAQNLGVDVPEGVTEAINLAQGAFNVGTAVANALANASTGNFVAVGGAVLSLLRKSEPDVGAQRHTQVMGALNRLAKGQEKILKNQAKLFKNQQDLLKGQREIFKSIHRVGRLVLDSRNTLLTAIEEIRDDVLYNRRMVRDSISEEFKEITGYLRQLKNAKGYKPELLRFETYGQLYAFTESRKIPKSFFNFEYEHYSPANPIHTLFFLRSHASSGPARDEFDLLKESYDQVLNFWKSASEANAVKPATMSLLRLPIRQLSLVDSKYQALKDVDDTENGERNRFLFQNLSTELLSTEILTRLVDQELHFHYWFQLIDENTRKAKSPDRLTSVDFADTRGRSRLSDLKTFLDLAIIQQCLRAGECMLPYLYSELKAAQGDEPDPARTKSLIKLLNANPYLVRNLLCYSIHRDLAPDHTRYTYEVGLNNHASADTLSAALGSDWSFALQTLTDEKKHWSMSLVAGDAKGAYLLPLSPTIFADDNLAFDPDLDRLIQARTSLDDGILEYDLLKNLSDASKKLLADSAYFTVTKYLSPPPES